MTMMSGIHYAKITARSIISVKSNALQKELHLLIFIFNHKAHLMKNAILCNWRKILAIGWAHKSYQVEMST